MTSAPKAPADEIDRLWRGELVLEAMLTWPDRPLRPDDRQTLWDLFEELKRIRLLCAKRQYQRRKARQGKRAART